MGRLKGLRLWVSVVLEAGDVALPLIRAFWQRLGQAVSWLLVSLVGRALGLIWAGISMSMHGARQRDGSARRRSASKPGGPWPREAW